MHRLDLAKEAAWLLGRPTGRFHKHLDDVLHESQIVATIAEVIQRDGYDFTDDKSYLGFAHEMKRKPRSGIGREIEELRPSPHRRRQTRPSLQQLPRRFSELISSRTFSSFFVPQAYTATPEECIPGFTPTGFQLLAQERMPDLPRAIERRKSLTGNNVAQLACVKNADFLAFSGGR